MNLFEYPELCTMILQYLSTKQIVSLFCRSNIISSSIEKSSYIMNVDIMYNPNADYTNFPAQHFTLCTSVHHEEDELRNVISKFHSSKFIYNAEIIKDEYCVSEYRVFEYTFLCLFDRIDPQHYLYYNNPLNEDNIRYKSKYKLNYNKNCNNKCGVKLKHNVIDCYCNKDSNNKDSNKTIKIDKLSENPNDTNCSIYIYEKHGIEIANTNINDLIICNSSNITVKSKINNNVVIDNCEGVVITQKYLKQVIFKNRVFDCKLNNVGVLDASTVVILPYDRNDYECPYKHRCEHSRGIVTKNVNKLHIGDYYEEDNVFKCVENLHYTTPMEYDEYNEDYYDYSFSGLIDSNNIRNLELYIYNKLVISNYKNLEHLKVSFKSSYYEYDYDHIRHSDDKEYKKCEIDGTQMLIVSDCPNLREITIDRSIINIHYDVSNCKNLSSINIVSDVEDTIGSGCDKVKVYK